jgi:hypothetical protein
MEKQKESTNPNDTLGDNCNDLLECFSSDEQYSSKHRFVTALLILLFPVPATAAFP